jgi:hypothetical protein
MSPPSLRVVIWGYKPSERRHEHTHGYVHEALYKAFAFLGYSVSWYPDTEKSRTTVLISELSLLSNAVAKEEPGKKEGPSLLIIAEGNQCKHLPVVFYASYLLHNAPETKKMLRLALCHNVFNLQVYTARHLKQIPHRPVKGAENEHGFQHGTDMLIMCWATDLLPHEIDANMAALCAQEEAEGPIAGEINMVGMPTHVWTEDAAKWCKARGIALNFYGGFTKESVPSGSEHARLVQRSVIAPALQERRQVRCGYVPCRLFKNISYGKLGVSNNPHLLQPFRDGGVFDPPDMLVVDKHVPTLLDKALALGGTKEERDLVLRQMKFVRDRHTYVNRVRLIEAFIKSNHRHVDVTTTTT